MTPREILEAAVASLPEGLPRPEVRVAYTCRPHWARDVFAAWNEGGKDVHVVYVDASCADARLRLAMGDASHPAVAHVLGEVARLLEQGGGE